MSDRPDLFYELTNSLCSTCYRKVGAKRVFQNGAGGNHAVAEMPVCVRSSGA